MSFIKKFQKKKLIIGMIHVDALPGTPNNKYFMKQKKNHEFHEETRRKT